MRKLCIILALILSLSTLCACNSDVQWFKRKDDGRFKGVKDTELELNTYYIKQGTKFFEIFNDKEGALSSQVNAVSGDRVIPLTIEDLSKTPSHYINEGVAFKSNDKIISEISLERFKSLGYSIGLYNGTFDDTGYLHFSKRRNVAEDSDIAKYLEDYVSDDIRIISVNGEKITPSTVDIDAGVIPNLEANKIYTVQMYIGTTFVEQDIVADTLMLKSYEYYSYDNSFIEFTSNGYMIFQTPDTLKSGYYFINGQGVFKYYAYRKGDKDETSTDMNESFYADEKSMLEAQSRQYSIDINTKVKDLAIKVEYADQNIMSGEVDKNEMVRGYVYGPDGTQYSMDNDTKKHTLTLNLTEALPGEWTVNVAPKNIEIIDVKVDSTKVEEEATLKSKDFEYIEDETNVRFTCTANTNEDAEVYGYVTSPDGRTFTMTYEFDRTKKEGVIYYDAPFVLKGTWTIKVYYHPTVTDLSEIEAVDNTETDTDIIIISD